MNSSLDPDKLQGIYPFCYSHVAIGNSRSGKSFSLLNALKDSSGFKILDRIINGHDIYIISPTAKLDDSMGKIIDLLKSKYKDFNDD